MAVWLVCWLRAGVAEPVPLRVAHLAEPPVIDAAGGAAAALPDAQSTRVAVLTSRRHGIDWYQLQLAGDWQVDSRPLLAIRGILTGRVAVYVPPDYQPQVLRVFDAKLDSAYSRRAMVYPLPYDLRADQPIFIATGEPGHPVPVHASIEDSTAYHAADLRYVRANTFFVTVQVSMLLVIACFWLLLRERMYLYFIGYQLCLVAFAMSQTGELYGLPGGAALGAARLQFTNGIAALVPAFGILFVLDFANLRLYAPRLAKALAVACGAFLGVAVLMALPFPWWLANPIVRTFNGLLIIATLVALVANGKAWRRGNRQAGFFLLSWLPLLALLMVRAAQQIQDLLQPKWMEYGFAASMAYAALIIAIALAERTEQTRRERDQATHLAQFDPLTGALNRRAILAQLADAWAAPGATATRMAVLFLDIDRFKQINDTCGHAAGDACLTAVTRTVRGELGEEDRLGRFGGEEFVVLLRGEHASLARQVAERIRARVAALEVACDARIIRLSVSIGIAQREEATPSVEALVAHADQAQYQAKAAGRNRVVEYRGATVAAPVPAYRPF
ncbi:diguanylate cyclase [Dokdonella sp.]|uniref:GGDEF domain-containing protein n=1 Tax=Dokdonella sp. TaxID=2291710 RepID=UPI0031BDA1F2|nr:GGDEF domain-containing protein [Dokdonella sp.]